MPTGPLTPDHDQPEKTPVEVSVWSAHWLSFASFNPIPRGTRNRVLVPFPLRPVVHPERGVVLQGLWGDSPPYDADAVLAMARRGRGGFRFADADGPVSAPPGARGATGRVIPRPASADATAGTPGARLAWLVLRRIPGLRHERGL